MKRFYFDWVFYSMALQSQYQYRFYLLRRYRPSHYNSIEISLKSNRSIQVAVILIYGSKYNHIRIYNHSITTDVICIVPRARVISIFCSTPLLCYSIINVLLLIQPGILVEILYVSKFSKLFQVSASATIHEIINGSRSILYTAIWNSFRKKQNALIYLIDTAINLAYTWFVVIYWK